MELGIYIHIPFCIKKCYYCDFVSYSNKFDVQEKYAKKIIEEIEDNKKLLKENKITIKFQSPLCTRRREQKKDYYYSFENEKFEETLKINIKEQLKITNIPEETVDTLKITPIKAKKVIIKFYEKQIECSTGTFELEGDIELLNYLYKAGIGSKHSAGFGMFQIV